MNLYDRITGDNGMTSEASAARDRASRVRRISRCQKHVGRNEWIRLLDQAREQLVVEYGHPHIPTTLIANRACELVEEAKI